jgi:uncharacterized protein YdaU (DUF1376 family)
VKYFSLNIGDHLKAAHHLTASQEGFYMRLLCLYFDSENVLPLELPTIHRRVRAVSDQDKADVLVVLEDLFQLCDAGWRHRDAEEQLDKYHDKRTKAQESVNARWEKARKGANRNTAVARETPSVDTESIRTYSERSADVILTSNHKPVTNNQERANTPPPPSGGRKVKPVPEGFELFWKTYPRKVGMAAAIRAFGKLTAAQVQLAIDALPRHVRLWQSRGTEKEFLPHASSWLNGQRWTDELETSPRPIPTKPLSNTAQRLQILEGFTHEPTAELSDVVAISYRSGLPEASPAPFELSASGGDVEWDPDGVDGGPYSR